MTTKEIGAIQVLKDVHRRVIELLEKYKDDMPAQDKESLLADLWHEMSLLDALEVQVFYPAIKDYFQDAERCAEDHNHIKVLFAQVQRLMGNEEEFDERVHELFEAIKSHLSEDSQVFRKVEKSGIDLSVLGRDLINKKESITAHTLSEKNRLR